MFTIIRIKRTSWTVTAAAAAMAAALAILCGGCSDNGIGGAFTLARNGGNNECGKDGTAGSCKTVKIGNQTWMAQNLNYKPSSGNSWCYENKEIYCDIYGRLYDWSTAKSACDKMGGGWHLPSRAEWDTLVAMVGGSSAGKALKSTYGWYDDGNGSDAFGFSALPGGYRYYSDGSFTNAGNDGNWWTAEESSSGYAYYRYMYDYNDYVDEYYYYNDNAFSVRCVAD